MKAFIFVLGIKVRSFQLLRQIPDRMRMSFEPTRIIALDRRLGGDLQHLLIKTLRFRIRMNDGTLSQKMITTAARALRLRTD
jgi:hypothetical protein